MIPTIQIEHVVKRYGQLQALAGVSLDSAEGEFFGLHGPFGGPGRPSLR